MSSNATDPSDPYVRGAQTFPVLSEDEVARLLPFGRQEDVPDGTVLFRRGQAGNDFFVVLAGSIEIVDAGSEDGQSPIYAHRRHQFAGELNLFNDRRLLVSGRVAGSTRVLRIRRQDFRRMMTAEPAIGETIMRAFILRRMGFIQHLHGAVTLLGASHSGDLLAVQRFLARNSTPHRVLDPDGDADARDLMAALSIGSDDLPAAILNDGEILRRPSTSLLADRLGLNEPVGRDEMHDVAVIGAGPAGLAAALYAASEGLSTIVIEVEAPGGQAGTSSRIENYLGFPTGISGQALAGRARVQAERFGARLAVSSRAIALDCDGSHLAVALDDGRRVLTRSVVVATGARYRRLSVPDPERFEGRGIHYAATAMEAKLCTGEEVVVVGGGNSAGQAAVFLSRHSAHVNLLVRRDGLAETMSDYLVQRIVSSERITVHHCAEVAELAGSQALETVTWMDRRTGRRERRSVSNIFVMIGADPNTAWLDGRVALDAKGFVLTGVGTDPVPFATSRHGVFAVGDVRSGSIKRVASAVGEGSVVISAVHQHLQAS